MNEHLTRNRLLLAQPLHHISCLQIHLDRIAITFHLVVEALDLGEGGFETVPLGFVLGAAGGDGDGVGEGGVVGPELEFGERGAAGEEIEDGAYDGFLLGGEGDGGGGVDVGVFDFEIGGG